jgi:hypothetical protein
VEIKAEENLKDEESKAAAKAEVTHWTQHTGLCDENTGKHETTS